MDLYTRFVVRRRQELNCLDFLPSSHKQLALAMRKHVHSYYLVRFSPKRQRSFRSNMNDLKLLVCSCTVVIGIYV